MSTDRNQNRVACVANFLEAQAVVFLNTFIDRLTIIIKDSTSNFIQTKIFIAHFDCITPNGYNLAKGGRYKLVENEDTTEKKYIMVMDETTGTIKGCFPLKSKSLGKGWNQDIVSISNRQLFGSRNAGVAKKRGRQKSVAGSVKFLRRLRCMRQIFQHLMPELERA